MFSYTNARRRNLFQTHFASQIAEIEKGKKSVDFEGREKEVIEILIRFNSQNKHKMIPIPICTIPKEIKY